MSNLTPEQWAKEQTRIRDEVAQRWPWTVDMKSDDLHVENMTMSATLRLEICADHKSLFPEMRVGSTCGMRGRGLVEDVAEFARCAAEMRDIMSFVTARVSSIKVWMHGCPCALCGGRGKNRGGPCKTCDGKGTIN